ncbi:MAG: hypothetical protein HY360_17100 [Verrucomicrobia bacterium]|nr:hypothetical protein [Verrucomicrobiota bacterium]
MGLAVIIASGVAVNAADSASKEKFLSHPPMRPLPVVSDRPKAPGPACYVDARNGRDANDGSEAKPWQTLAHAVPQLKPGDTLYLRGGIYYEHVTVTQSGLPEKPITIRSYPGELAVMDGGLREFYENPSVSWEPCPDGVPGEFRSKKTYPDLGGAVDSPNVTGNFGDSMIPLQPYSFRWDLQSTNQFWNLKEKAKGDATNSIYCGPGLLYNPETGRIHTRLAHTDWKFLEEEDRYRGETDPRKLPLVIAGVNSGSPLALKGVKHLRLQDFVVRGAQKATVDISNAQHVELDGLDLYGGNPAISLHNTQGFRLLNSACRGIGGPWTFRHSLKYRSMESKIIKAGEYYMPEGNEDFELAYCEFTDSVDGVFIGNVNSVKIHHCYLDNISDDGIFLTAHTGYDGKTPGGNIHVYQSLLSRCLTPFAFGHGHGRQKAIAPGVMQTGAGLWIYRNIFDFRRPVHYSIPTKPDDPQEITSVGRIAADHGAPLWEPMHLYHNTVLTRDDQGGRGYYFAGMGSAQKGSKRRIFNNVLVQQKGMPGCQIPDPMHDLQMDGNLHWSLSDGTAYTGDFFSRFRESKTFEESQSAYPGGLMSRDLFEDPQFVRFTGNWRDLCDLRLQKGSPAIRAGALLPPEWPDPFQKSDPAKKTDLSKPDMGAIPFGADPWRIGVRGRFSVFGERLGEVPEKELALPASDSRKNYGKPSPASLKPIAIVEGYPTEDPPVMRFIIQKMGGSFESYGGVRGKWLDTKEYSKYGTVAIVGWLVRAGLTDVYSADDVDSVDAFLRAGGTLLLSHDLLAVFGSHEGTDFLGGFTGESVRPGEGMVKKEFTDAKILKPSHPWVKHLDPKEARSWLGKLAWVCPLPVTTGENIIGDSNGQSLLWRIQVGKGQLVYVGWQMGTFLPKGRGPVPSVEQEKAWEENYKILESILSNIPEKAASP